MDRSVGQSEAANRGWKETGRYRMESHVCELRKSPSIKDTMASEMEMEMAREMWMWRWRWRAKVQNVQKAESTTPNLHTHTHVCVPKCVLGYRKIQVQSVFYKVASSGESS